MDAVEAPGAVPQARFDPRGLVELDETIPRVARDRRRASELRRAPVDHAPDQPRAAPAASTSEGVHEVTVRNPGAKHSLGVGILQRCKIAFEGSLGYFACGLIDGPEVHITGRVGWSACENMMSGVCVIDGNAGSLTAAALRGGDVVVRGQVGARTGIDQKGGTIIVARRRRLDDRVHDAARPADHLRQRRPRSRRLDVRRRDLRRRQGRLARDRLRARRVDRRRHRVR